jgi:CheY-like chemotaxis protein
MQQKKILLVEDNPALATALTMRLGATGYQILRARSIAEAMSKLSQRRPDVSLIDINLPDGDGFSLAQQIHANPNIPLTPIVFITASSSPAYLERAFEFGPVAFLEKPIDPRLLITAIEQSPYSMCEFSARTN